MDGHVVRMKDDRIHEALLYGRLTTGIPKRGNHKTYLNSVKSTLRGCDTVAQAEKDHVKRLIEKRRKRKARADLANLPT